MSNSLGKLWSNIVAPDEEKKDDKKPREKPDYTTTFEAIKKIKDSKKDE